MITLTEEERSFLYSLTNDLYQNWNTRSLEEELLTSILGKLNNTNISITEKESRRIQYWLLDRAELYSRIAEPRSQHILAQHNSQGFGRDHGNQEHYFNGAKMYLLCKAILAKLVGS